VGEYQKTYSAVFSDPSLDERPFIRDVISSTKAQPNWVKPTAEGFLDELDSLLWHQEEPFVSSSIYAQWCVFRKVKESGVKVVLDGQGADEQLCGYRKFSYFLLGELARQRSVAQLFKEGLLAWKNLSYFKGVDFKHSLRYSRLGRRYARLPSLVRSDVLMSDSRKPIVNIGYGGSLAQRIKMDITRFSLPSLLRYEDKNSMAFSVESRTPYLDFRLVEYLAALPLRAKIHRGWTKYILRHAMQGIIPEKIRWRRDKLAFDTPQNDWLRNKWRTAFSNTFREDNILSECLDQQELFMEYNRFLSNRSRISGNFFFRAFVLQRWAQQFSLHSL
jgi:asparagine synthase (glutamine-hydrolysing)